MSLEIDTSGFHRQVAQYLGKSREMRVQAARALFFELLRLVILKTPVDTGRARGGWGAGVEAMGLPASAMGAAGPGYPEGRQRSEYSEKHTGSRIRLSCVNGVEYIEALENGWSTQAPFGMLRISMRELEQRLGGRDLPDGIRRVYERTWRAMGMRAGTPLRAGSIMEALDLTPGMNVTEAE